MVPRKLYLSLVRTLANTVVALIRPRNRTLSLLLNDLEAYLTNPNLTSAGIKQLANLLHSNRWKATCIVTFLLDKGNQQVVLELNELKKNKRFVFWTATLLRNQRA
jgi:hypothetical protein